MGPRADHSAASPNPAIPTPRHPHHRGSILGWGLLLLVVFPGTSEGQWAGWTARWENDSFAAAEPSDGGYTSGLRFTLEGEEAWDWAESLVDGLGLESALSGESPTHVSTSLVFGQDIFTPDLITDAERNPRDRPYAGHLYAGTRIDLTQDAATSRRAHRLWQHSLEATAGILGRGSLGETLQKTVHTLLTSPLPKGWRHQLETEPAVQIAWDSRVGLRTPISGDVGLDLTPHGGLSVGSVQTLARIGGTLRVGSVEGLPTAFEGPTGTPDLDHAQGGVQWSIHGAYEYRAYLHDAYVDGGLIRDGVNLETDRLVGQLRLGATLRYRGWSLTYSHVEREPELEAPANGSAGGQGGGFGSLMVSRRLTGTRPSDDTTRWWARDWLVETSVGSGRSREEPAARTGGSRPGASTRVSVAKGLTERILLGVELDAMSYERRSPEEPGRHLDDFYVVRALTMGWRPWGRDRLLVLRAGAGQALVRTRDTIVRESVETRHWVVRDQSRLGWVVGASYGVPLGDRVSLGLDVAAVEIPAGGTPDEPRISYLSWGFGLKWHP